MSWTLVESDGDLAEVKDRLKGAKAVAVDTEFMRRDTYYPKIALLQLCADNEAWLIDPLGVTDQDVLRGLLRDGEGHRVLHSCSEDLEVFRHWLGAVPSPLIDSQRAAALLGEGFGLGYRALVERLLGVDLEKGETRSDWLKRPLTDSQCHYAAQDVIQLLPAWEMLRERAESQGRMAWILEESEEVILAQDDREGELYRRVKGAGRLNRRELAVLRNLVVWRETRAREVDKPRGWVLDDKACLAISQQLPDSPDRLATIENIPPAVLRRQGDALLACVKKALELSADALPPAFPGPLTPAQRDTLKALREQAKKLAADIDVAPEILLSTADLELLIREADGAPIKAPRRWSGWRRELAIEPLRTMIGGAA